MAYNHRWIRSVTLQINTRVDRINQQKELIEQWNIVPLQPTKKKHYVAF